MKSSQVRNGASKNQWLITRHQMSKSTEASLKFRIARFTLHDESILTQMIFPLLRRQGWSGFEQFVFWLTSNLDEMVPLLFSKIGTRSNAACYESVAQGSLTIDYLNSMTQFSGKPSKYEKLLNVRFFYGHGRHFTKRYSLQKIIKHYLEYYHQPSKISQNHSYILLWQGNYYCSILLITRQILFSF